MSPAVPTPTGAGPSRTPVQFDERTGGLRIGPYERHVEDPRQPEQVYGAYLSLLYAVRRAQPGERLPLRSADLEALLLLVGDDPATIESRLVDLMGCTPAEAGVLGRLLLRQRRATATLGIAAGLSLAGLGLAPQLTGSEQAAAPVPAVEQPSAVTPPTVGQSVEAPVPLAPLVAAPVAPVLAVPLLADPVPAAPVLALPPAPVRAVVVGPQASAPVVAAPAAAAAAPVVEPAPAIESAPVVATPAAPQQPVEVAPEDRYTLPLVEEPMWDAPPPVDVPESDIGEAVSLVPGPLEPISGVTDSGPHAPVEPISGVTDSGHDTPVEAPAPPPPAVEDVEAPVPAVQESVPPAVPAAEQVQADPEA